MQSSILSSTRCKLRPNSVAAPHVLSTTRCKLKPKALPVSSLDFSSELEGKKVLIVGGTGRVGSSTASALLKTFPNLKVTVTGRMRSSYDACKERRPEISRAGFVQLDLDDSTSIKMALSEKPDLVIHAAGPFQCSSNHSILQAAIESKVAYLDVSDDSEYSEASISRFGDGARDAQVPAIVSAGIFPGTSSVMASHIISISRNEYNEDWSYREQSGKEKEELPSIEPNLLRYSYYTAGSGGAGGTILETSLLLAGIDAKVYKDGQEFTLPPVSNRREVDFGPGIGNKGLYVYNLPEVFSAYKHLGVKGVSARFGTDPPFWNWAMWLTARLVPRALLGNKDFVSALAKFAEPMVRATDKGTGESVGMKIEVDFVGGKNAAGIFVHSRFSDAVGMSTAAFARAMLLGQTKAGVWYPEQKEALSDRRTLLKLASQGCDRFDLNKPVWSLESELSSFAGMIYW